MYNAEGNISVFLLVSGEIICIHQCSTTHVAQIWFDVCIFLHLKTCDFQLLFSGE